MTKTKIIWALAAIILIGGVVWLVRTPGKPGQYDSFASCLKDSGAIFYGAFWCPHCQNQKAMFGRSAKLLPYQECSTPDGQSQLKECTDAGVQSYPTWVFPNGERRSGEVSLADLSTLTSCPLPQQ